jgi:hypothetical protein
MEPASGRVQVYARVRPYNENEAGLLAVEMDDGAKMVRVRNDEHTLERVLQGQAADAAIASSESREYLFDGVFAMDATQRDVFMQVGLPVLREALKGINGTILAYGQTGSGKTHSLLHQTQKGEEAGLLPRLVASLFVQIAQDMAHVYEVEAASVQVYNEQIDDLLHPEHQSGGGHNLKVQDGGVVQGLTWIKCRRPEEMLELFTHARANVVYAETKMNKASSRSHAVFQLKITRRMRVFEATNAQKMECTMARLNIVDLAGSERVKKSGSEGLRFQEATAINKSLLAFGNVVSALAAKKAHIPLRDSKLTRILDGSIGGNCRTALLVCASPAVENVGETINTFEFASRAMRVEVDAKVNTAVVEVSAKALLADLSNDGELGGIPLAPQLEALKKQSAEAAAKAKTEAALREKAVQDAQVQARKLQKAAEEAEQRSRKFQEKAEILQKDRDSAQSEVEQMRQSVSLASEEAKEAKLAAEAATKLAEQKAREADKLRALVEKAEQEALEWKAAAEVRAQEVKEVRVVQAKKDTAELVKKKEEIVQVQKDMAKATQEVMVVKRQATEAFTRASEAEARAVAAEEAVAAEREQAAAALEIAQLEADKKLEEVRVLHQKEKLTFEKTLQAAELEANSQRAQIRSKTEEAEKLEAQVRAATEELSQTSLLLDEARAALEALRKEADEKEARLRTEHQAELRALQEAHAKEVEELFAQLEASRSEGLKELEKQQQLFEEERLKHKGEVTSMEILISHKAAIWEEEQANLQRMHAAEIDAQRQEFETRLAAGIASFEERLAEAAQAAESQRQLLVQQLDAARDEIQKTEERWKDVKEMAVREAWENGNSQQRRLAAAFKAARNIAQLKEEELKKEHEHLAQRFASRESREEDLEQIALQQKRLQEHQRLVQMREREMKDIALELQNRDDCDRIFGAAEKRRPRQTGMGQAVLGKKLGETNIFAERERKRQGRAFSQGSNPTTPHNVFVTSAGAAIFAR